MWRKQSEGKPSSSVTPAAPSAFAPPSYAPPEKSAGSLQSSSKPAPAAPPAPVPSPEAAMLTQGIRIRGELTGKADLFIDGDVEGSVRLGDSRLTDRPERPCESRHRSTRNLHSRDRPGQSSRARAHHAGEFVPREGRSGIASHRYRRRRAVQRTRGNGTGRRRARAPSQAQRARHHAVCDTFFPFFN